MDDFQTEIQTAFLEEAKELLQNSEHCFLSLEKAGNDPALIAEIFRLAHNLKGSAGAVGFTELADFAHHLETFLLRIKNQQINLDSKSLSLLLACNDHLVLSVDRLQKNPQATLANDSLKQQLLQFSEEGVPSPRAVGESREVLASNLTPKAIPHEEAGVLHEVSLGISQPRVSTTDRGDESIRVALSKIDHLLNGVGELVILQAVMNEHKTEVESGLVRKTIDSMAKIIREVQGLSMSLRMVPLKATFQKMQRIVRDTSLDLNKEVEIELVGETTEIDKTVLEQLGDPLVHLIRNAVDHGLEDAEERIAAGKPAKGKIRLSAIQKTDKIFIEIRDDGRGLDAEKIKRKAFEKKIINAGSDLTDQQAHQLIFAPGFSTKESVTDVSGRGVGMDVVKTNISRLQGQIEIETELGHGTCFRIILPLSLAIMEAMVVRLGSERYVLPIHQVREFYQFRSDEVVGISPRGRVLSLRGEVVPVFGLGELLRRPGHEYNSLGVLIITELEQGKTAAVQVDEILHQQQVVIKNVGGEIAHFPGLAGASVMGDGKVSFILDLNELVGRVNPRPNNLSLAL